MRDLPPPPSGLWHSVDAIRCNVFTKLVWATGLKLRGEVRGKNTGKACFINKLKENTVFPRIDRALEKSGAGGIVSSEIESALEYTAQDIIMYTVITTNLHMLR